MAYRILILGANGFIGRRLVEALERSPGAIPVAAVRNPSRAEFGPRVQLTTLDATDRPSLKAAMIGIEGVVNCVAGSAKTIIDSATALASVLAEIDQPPRLVHLSSLAAYGTTRGPVDENTPLRGDLNEYSAAKVAAERALEHLASVIILRPGIVYGARSPWWSDRIARLLVSRRLGHLGPDGEGICNLLYIDDVVLAITRALEISPTPQPVFNLSVSFAPSWNEYFLRYAQALGVAPLRQISRLRLAIEATVIAPVLKVAEVLAGSKRSSVAPPIRPWLLDHCRHVIQMQVGRAESVLGMRWTPLDEGLRQTAMWYLDGGRT